MPKRLECAVKDCSQKIETGFRTCSLPEHRAIEDNFYQRGKSIFQLRTRLKNAINRTYGDDAMEEDEEPAHCAGKSEEGNCKIKASFSK